MRKKFKLLAFSLLILGALTSCGKKKNEDVNIYTPGAALVLLMAGPAVNVASILVIRKVLGRRTLCLYLAAIVSGAFAFALGIDHLLPREWFTSALTAISAPCHADNQWFNIVCTVVLGLLIMHALISRYRHRDVHECQCGKCEGTSCTTECSEEPVPSSSTAPC